MFFRIWLLVKSDNLYESFGLILMKTFPYCGGYIDSPPIIVTASASGYMYFIKDS